MDPVVDPVPVGWTETDPEQYVYNVPDAYEQDPEIIRAELMFFNTPQSQAFSGEAYYALKNVQDQCMADYSKFCTTSYVSFGDAQTLMEKLFTSSLPFLMSRRLRETGSASIPSGHSGRKLVEYMRSFYVPKQSEALSSVKDRSSSVAQASVSMKERESKPVNGVRSHVMRGDNAKLNRAIKAEKSKKDSRRQLRSDDTFVGDALNVAPSQIVRNVAVSEEAEGVTIVTISDASESQEVPVLMVDPPMIVEDIGFVGQMSFIASHSRPAPELGYGVPMRASRFEPAVLYPADMEPSDLSSQPPAQERPPARPLPPSQDDDKDNGKRPEKPLPNKPQPGDEDPGHHHPPPHRPPGRDDGSDGQEPPRPPRDGRDDHHDPHHDRDHRDHDRDHDHHHGHESDSDDDGDSEDEGEGDHFARHSRHRAHGHFHGLEDRFFPGSLGYGASGDMCLYENAQNLSPPCAQAISDVYVLREQYWTSYSDAQEMGHHHHPVMGFFVLGLVLVVLVKKIMYMPRRRHVHKFLTALNANPELKAQLESQLNMEIPLPKNATCCGGARQSFCRRLVFAVGFLFFAVVASLFIAVTTLEMTAGILNGMAAHADGDAPPASVPFVLFVMLTIMVAQLFLLRLIVRSVGGLWRRNCGATIDDNQPGANDDSESSAPSSNSNHGNGGGGVQVEFQRLTSLPVSFYREYVSPRVSSFFATRSATSEGYAPLQAGEEREMIPVGRQTVPSTHGGAHYAVYTGVPVNPHSVVQVTARPVSAVSLV